MEKCIACFMENNKVSKTQEKGTEFELGASYLLGRCSISLESHRQKMFGVKHLVTQKMFESHP
jgi:hypothetical protein